MNEVMLISAFLFWKILSGFNLIAVYALVPLMLLFGPALIYRELNLNDDGGTEASAIMFFIWILIGVMLAVMYYSFISIEFTPEYVGSKEFLESWTNFSNRH